MLSLSCWSFFEEEVDEVPWHKVHMSLVLLKIERVKISLYFLCVVSLCATIRFELIHRTMTCILYCQLVASTLVLLCFQHLVIDLILRIIF